MNITTTHIGIVGAGASAVYTLNGLLKDVRKNGAVQNLEITIFEKGAEFGAGMPYSANQVDRINVVNILPEEVPALEASFIEWLKTKSDAELRDWGIPDRNDIGRKFYSRVLMGEYLRSQYQETVRALRAEGVIINEHSSVEVVDAVDNDDLDNVKIICADGSEYQVSKMIISTGHVWPDIEASDSRNFKSPWPIEKVLSQAARQQSPKVGILGASLSAFDVLVSLAERNGHFEVDADRAPSLKFMPNDPENVVQITLHSTYGRLPHIRPAFRWSEVKQYRFFESGDVENLIQRDGRLKIDAFFNELCKPQLIKDLAEDDLGELATRLQDHEMTFSGFIQMMSSLHNYDDAFIGMRAELAEARESFEHDQPVRWKETLDELMYTLNSHMTSLSAEDLIFLKGEVSAFIANITAYLPHESAEKLLALREAGVISIAKGRVIGVADESSVVSVKRVDAEGSEITDKYDLFVDSTGQQTTPLSRFPMQSLVRSGSVREAFSVFADTEEAMRAAARYPAQVKQRDGVGYIYLAGGIEVDNSFRIIGSDGQPSSRIFDIAYPHIKGQRLYCTGLQECHDVGLCLATQILAEHRISMQCLNGADIQQRNSPVVEAAVKVSDEVVRANLQS